MKKMKFDDCDDDDISSPNSVLEDYFRSVEYATASSKSTSLDSKSLNGSSKHIHRWQRFIGSIKARSATELTKLYNIKVLLNLTRTKSTKSKSIGSTALFEPSHQCQSFTLSELQNATNNFSHENLVGKGGYAEVYIGCLSSGKLVAIKRLARGKLDEKIGDFLTEVGIMVHVDHPNTAKLIGYGIEGGMHLV